MRTIYFRPGMPIVESGREISRLYEWFGEQNGIEIRMNDFTFTQILYRININPNDKIMFFDEPMFVYGYRVQLVEDVPDFYVNIFDFSDFWS